jgi:hypothetical protein
VTANQAAAASQTGTSRSGMKSHASVSG